MTVDRLDFSEPPPGFSAPYENPVNDCWHLMAPVGEQYFTACRQTPHEAITHAWAHYKERHDPPGMKTLNVRMSGWWCPYVQHENGEYYPVDAIVRDAATQEIARAAAWFWYERRLALYNVLRGISPPREFWPLILTWSDKRVVDVIVAGGADAGT